MKKIMNYFRTLKMKCLMKYLEGQEGLVAIEYALIAFFIAVAIVAVVTTLGQKIVAVFQMIANALP